MMIQRKRQSGATEKVDENLSKKKMHYPFFGNVCSKTKDWYVFIAFLFSLSIITYNTIAVERDASKSTKKMRHGNEPNSWKVIDWQDNPISPEEEVKFDCDWTTFKSASSGKNATICVHSFHDFVSDSIKQNKRWSDCDVLPDLWNLPTSDSSKHMDKKPVYVDIGTNIGSCVMEMLLGTDAHIIAFEPHPMNLYNLKKTVSVLDKSYQDRLTLFPIGLGDAQGNSKIYSASNNMGNSVIGKKIKDFPSQNMEDEKLQFTVHVERLDSVLDTDIDVKLLKLDAQGYECRILEGMGKDIANKIEMIKFEYAHHWLQEHNCTDIIPRLKSYGFDIFRKGDKYGFSQPFNGQTKGRDVFDLFASKKRN